MTSKKTRDKSSETEKINEKPTPTDLNADDKMALGDRAGNLRNDGAADEQLKNRKRPVDFEGKDLDVPGRSQSAQNTRSSLNDEENELYSPGDDDREDLA